MQNSVLAKIIYRILKLILKYGPKKLTGSKKFRAKHLSILWYTWLSITKIFKFYKINVSIFESEICM